MTKMKWDQLLDTKTDGDVDWGLLLTTLFWNLNYWDSVSTMASEVGALTTLQYQELIVPALYLFYVFTVIFRTGQNPKV